MDPETEQVTEGEDFNPFADTPLEGDGTPAGDQTPPPAEPTADPNQQQTPPTVVSSATPATPAVTPPATVPPATATPPVTPEIPSTISLTPEQLLKLTAAPATTTPATPTAPQPGEPGFDPKTLPPEEFDKYYAIVRPTEEQLAAVFRGGKEGTTELMKLLHATATMGATIAARHMKEELHDLRSEFSSQVGPVVARTQQEERDRHAAAFFSEYDNFTQEHTPVLMAVYQQLVNEGFKGTPKEVYAKVAERATVLMKTVNAQFEPKKNPATQPPTTSGRQTVPGAPTSQMASLVTGSGGGTPKPTAASGEENAAAALFGDM